ncbi:unnamed protein product [Lepeophtheirus salmonis]|uniref:(salmon louse) hypothetical protein n=1 Tax=Lepeophtheirus salmonis TaxID=72036 RepID=A0A7R8HDW2_LEPSM|nr:unnamed protein product [Lepeophtheirus salmonis]CAF3043019.1 unnamed protein product [Lepeophtheirus salmonis]
MLITQHYGKHSLQLQAWTILFNPRYKVRLLDRNSGPKGFPSHGFQYTFQKILHHNLKDLLLFQNHQKFSVNCDRGFQGIPGTFPCADDVKVQESTEDSYDIHLLERIY